jgi:hypothetical protein
MMEERTVSIIFVREYKHFIAVFEKKSKEDYVLNVNKIIKEKFKTKFIVPNKIQSFLLNYEVKKLLDKAVNIKNQKYKQVIYLNSNISTSLILNTLDFIEDQYENIKFDYTLIKSKELDETEIREIERVQVVQVK